jgi:xanthine dehydrogenase YagS FAD-binding subunit
MQAFSFRRLERVDDALAAIEERDAKLLAGGTNLLDLMKGGIESPATILDISRLPCAGIEATPDGGVRLGALAKMSDVADHPLVRTRYPLLAQALLAGASQQLRNMASVGGNLMQRTRCYYFYDRAFPACNKRDPGTGCAARTGFNRIHAIFGASEQCVATHPSDMAVALNALDATVEVRSIHGERSIALDAFHRLPDGEPERDTNLAANELIVAITLPPSPFAQHTHYLKIRDRASFAFALVSVAAALDLRDGAVLDARIALGGVAHKPWRARGAELALIGRRLAPAAIEAAAEAAIRGAEPLQHNAFKIGLLHQAVAHAVRMAGGCR